MDIKRNLPKRIAYSILRLSRRFRCVTDLFDGTYDRLADWRGGLGGGNLLLYSIVCCLEADVVVEIGSARGKSTCSMALACRQMGRGKVYAIDPHLENAWTDRGIDVDPRAFSRRGFGSTGWRTGARSSGTHRRTLP